MGSVFASFDHETARDSVYLAVGALAPFVLRSVGDWTIGFITRKCCKMSPKELTKHLVGKGDSNHNVLLDNVIDNKLTWTQAKEGLEINQCAALFISIVRLIFWHCMQPLLYCYVLYAFWDLLDNVQQILGLIVAVREAIFFFMILLCTFRNPAFLLVDIRASCTQQAPLVAVYVIAPEKFIYLCLNCCRADLLNAVGILVLSILDIAGMVAFVWAIAVHKMYAPMMIGYAITTLGGFLIIMVMCVGCCMVGCSCCCHLKRYVHFSGDA